MIAKILLVIAFVAVAVAVGIYCRRHTGTVDGFILGGRNVGPWMSAFAYGTSYFSAVVFVGYAGQFGFKYGISATWAGIGNAIIGSLLAWWVLGPRTREMTHRLQASTMPEFFGKRYNSRALRIAAAAIIFVFLIPYTASVYNGLSRLFGMAFALPYDVCVIGMAVGIAFAVVIGLLHAFLQNTYDLPPFVVTLGTQYLMFGLAAIICNNYPIPNAYPNWYVQVGMGRLFGVVPYPVIIFFVAAVLCYFIMEHTTTGRCVYAVGGNQEAARLTGINVFRSKAFVFIAVQILAAIAGFINSAQVNQADWSYGKEWPTDCLSMAIIGGTSMAGGSGTIYGTVVGVVLISVLINGMTILNWNIYLQYIVRGAILIGSLVLMAYRDKYRD